MGPRPARALRAGRAAVLARAALHTANRRAGLDDRAGPRFRARARWWGSRSSPGAWPSGAWLSSWSAPRRCIRPSRPRMHSEVPGLLVLIAAWPIATLTCSRRNTAACGSLFEPGASASRRPGTVTAPSGHVTGAVLVRGADRAERVADAMRCRGFDGTFHTTAAFRTTLADILAFAALVARHDSPPPLGPRGAVVTQHSALTTHHLSHRYADGRVALDDVRSRSTRASAWRSWARTVRARRHCSCGLCGVLAGQPGEAIVCGLDPADPAHRKKLPETIGIVFQNPDDQLFSPTVLDDVAFGPLNLGLTVDEATRAGARGARGRRACDRRPASACRFSSRAATSGARRWRVCWRCARRCCCSTSPRRSSTRAAGAN